MQRYALAIKAPVIPYPLSRKGVLVSKSMTADEIQKDATITSSDRGTDSLRGISIAIKRPFSEYSINSKLILA
jgi:hypothetical protein